MSVFKQSGTVLILNWLIIPLNVATGILIARTLGPEGKGVLLLLVGTLGVLSSLCGLGLPAAAAYFHKQMRYTIGQIVAVCLLLAVVMTAAFVCLFVFYSGAFIRFFLGTAQNIVISPVWIWLTLGMLFPAIISPVGDVLLITAGDMKLYAVKNVGGALVLVILTWTFVLIVRWGVTGALLAQLLAFIMRVATLAYWLARQGALGGLRASRKAVHDMLAVGLQQYRVSLIAMVAKRWDTFLIAGMLTIRQAGYFSIAYQLYNLLQDIPRATMWPMVSKLAGGKSGDNKSQLAMFSRIQVAVLFFTMLVVAVMAHWFILLLYGKAFLPATAAVWAILPGIVVAPIIVSGNAYFTSKGMPGRMIVPNIIATGLQVMISLLLVPRIGVVGGSIALAANSVILSIVMIHLLTRHAGIRTSEMLFVSQRDLAILRDRSRRFVAGIVAGKP